MGKSAVVDRDMGWKEILARVVDISKGSFVRVGILGDDERGGLHKTDPETGKAAALTIAEIAVVQEFGTEDHSIPARPAHRMTFDAREQEIQAQAAKLLSKVVIDRTMKIEDALNIMGLSHATVIKLFITSQVGQLKANAPSTARMKARGTGIKRQKAIDGQRPLVDTGATLAALSWCVVLGSVAKEHKFLTARKP